MLHQTVYVLLIIQFASVFLQGLTPTSTEQLAIQKMTLYEEFEGPPAANVSFYLYKRDQNATLIDNDNLDELDLSLPFVIYVHGFSASVETSRAQLHAQAYIDKGGYNFVAADWSEEAEQFYTIAVRSAPDVGLAIAEFIYALYTDYNVHLEDFHVVGHSLGAHVAGYVGKAVQNLTDGLKIGRITGLDPAGFGFLSDNETRMNEDDADVVVAIHTNGLGAGIYRAVGTIDFYPNGGVLSQPGCRGSGETVGCSHGRSELLFIESVENSHAFLSKKCDSYSNYLDGLCDDNNTITIGGDLRPEDTGNYYLQTNSEYPYSLS